MSGLELFELSLPSLNSVVEGLNPFKRSPNDIVTWKSQKKAERAASGRYDGNGVKQEVLLLNGDIGTVEHWPEGGLVLNDMSVCAEIWLGIVKLYILATNWAPQFLISSNNIICHSLKLEYNCVLQFQDSYSRNQNKAALFLQKNYIIFRLIADGFSRAYKATLGLISPYILLL